MNDAYLRGYCEGYLRKQAAQPTFWGGLGNWMKGQWQQAGLRDQAARNAAPQWREWASRPLRGRQPVQSGPEAIRDPQPDMPARTDYFGPTTQAEVVAARQRLPAGNPARQPRPQPRPQVQPLAEAPPSGMAVATGPGAVQGAATGVQPGAARPKYMVPLQGMTQQRWQALRGSNAELN